jgi:hypothetical protein
MTRRVCLVLTLALLAARPAKADPYWLASEGDDFPENEAWTHLCHPPVADRWIQNAALVIDSLADADTVEYVSTNRPLDPRPRDLLVCRCGLKGEQAIGYDDPGVSIFSDKSSAVGFSLSEDTLFSSFQSGLSCAFAAGDFRAFELRSPDMRHYELYIDARLALTGSFWLSLWSSQLSCGHVVDARASLSRWDYFRPGVAKPGDVKTDGNATLADTNPLLLASTITEADLLAQHAPSRSAPPDCNQNDLLDPADTKPFPAPLIGG